MARTSLLVALALAAAPFTAHALGVVEPPPCCAAKAEENVCDIAGRCDTFLLPDGQCEPGVEITEVSIPCTGTFTCTSLGLWGYIHVGGSCASESTKSGCEEVNGIFIDPVGDECCGKCLKLS